MSFLAFSSLPFFFFKSIINTVFYGIFECDVQQVLTKLNYMLRGLYTLMRSMTDMELLLEVCTGPSLAHTQTMKWEIIFPTGHQIMGDFSNGLTNERCFFPMGQAGKRERYFLMSVPGYKRRNTKNICESDSFQTSG